MKKTAVLQSNYLPWKGYFDIINSVDLFIFYDDVQYTKNDWRNRNRIKTKDGVKWLTVPAGTDIKKLILDVRIKDDKWQRSHWDKIKACYSRAPFFKNYGDFFEDVYLGRRWEYLFELNRYLITNISSKFLGIKTEFADSRDFKPAGGGQERLLKVLKNSGADYYLSGPSAKQYIKDRDFMDAGIALAWMDYSDYPEYGQLYGKFEHTVSVIDLLFNAGENAPHYIWGHRKK